MRVRLGRKKLIAAGVLTAVILAAALSFGPIVRGRVAAEAERKHLAVDVGGVRPGWWAVRLVNVSVRPIGLDGVQARFDDVRVPLSLNLRPRRIEVTGGQLSVTGEASTLRKDLKTWRGDAGGASSTGSSTPISFAALSLRWEERSGDEPRIEARGVGGIRDDGEGFQATATDLRLKLPTGSLTLSDASIRLDSSHQLQRAHAGAAVLELAEATDDSPPPAQPPATSAMLPGPVAMAKHETAHAPRGAPPVDPGVPLLPLPDLHAARAVLASLAAAVADRIPEDADIGADAMTWKLTKNRIPITIGPGPFAVIRGSSLVELRFSTDTSAAPTPLAVRALLPLDDTDVSVTVEGGPVSLALLGMQEGAGGLVDVARATVTGKTRIVLSGDGSVVTFDAEGRSRGLSIREPKLAPDVVRGLDAEVRARGTLSAEGELRLDDFAATLGALHVSTSGMLAQGPDHVVAAVHFEVPTTTCQAMLDSVPTALLPVLSGTRIAGTFGARGRFAFDTRKLDELDLDYDIQDQCRVVEVPDALAREHFKRPFSHRIYRPDGSAGEQLTGPGTANWTPLGAISPYMEVAVLTTEDGGFPRHHGFNHAAIRASIVTNLKQRRFVRGASTISMQLAKNLFLTREKTLSRKLEEVVLTDYLEQTFSKDEMLELYFNVIEFGPDVYGITAASDYYFGRRPAELDLAECFFLASLLPAPLRYGGMRGNEQAPEGWMNTLRTYMHIAKKTGLISDQELTEGEAEPVAFWHGGARPASRPPAHMHGADVASDVSTDTTADDPSDGP
jgi:hypothetical protein